MLRRTGFKKRVYVPPAAAPLRALVRAGVVARISANVVAMPKANVVRHRGLREIVASLPCMACGISGISQCAHGNTGKGTGLKTDDRYSFPLCSDQPGRRGCHAKFDDGVLFSKEARRLIEPAWVADTHRRVHAMGMWPKNLPEWSGR